MKIKIKNFGPINNFETNLSGDLLFIVGQNNIGKSYAISLIYVLLKTFTNNELIGNSFYGGYFHNEIFKKISVSIKDEFLKSFGSNQGEIIAVTNIYKPVLLECFKIFFLDQFENSMLGTFGDISNLENRRDSGASLIILETDPMTITFKIENGKISLISIDLLHEIYLRPSKVRKTSRISSGKKVIYVLSGNPDAALNSIIFESVESFFKFVSDATSDIQDVHYLPASRSGLYQALSAFGQIIAELSKRRSFLSQRIELPAISEPLVDYFIKLTEIKISKKTDENRFAMLATELEKNILGGSVEFDVKNKRLFYKPFDTDLRLDLSSTSSMVSEVAPIATYLRYVLSSSDIKRGGRRGGVARGGQRKKQILFIEEPEAHLHPKTQTLMMEFFSDLIREHDLKIVMTSHSNFIFNKISNLIIKKSFGNSKVDAFLFCKTPAGTVGESLEVDDYGITDENFTEVSEEIFEEKIELIEKIK